MTQFEKVTLYTYWRSSASYRVRIALNLKGIEHELEPVHLVRDGGQQYADEYTALNPQALVPTLVHGQRVLTQSLAIIEYLDELFPGPMMLPGPPEVRARVRAIAQAIACEIHPLNNLRVLKYLTGQAGLDEEAKMAWYRHWTEQGLIAVERMLEETPGTNLYCQGDEPTLADCCLLPQVYNARRFECSLQDVPRIRSICDELEKQPAVRRAAPENQPDAE